MKQLLLLFTLYLAFSNSIVAQEEEKKMENRFWVRPGIELGIATLKNETIKTQYQINSLFSWGAVLYIGNPYQRRVGGYIQYSHA